MTKPKYRKPQADAESRLPADALIDEMLNYIRSGNSVSVACGLVGIQNSSFSRWMAEAQSPMPRKWCVDLHKRYIEAKSYALAANLQIIQKCAVNGDWRAASWFMERKEPEVWGKKAELEVSVSGDIEVVDSRTKLDNILDVMSFEIEQEEEESYEPVAQREVGSRPAARPSGEAGAA